MTDREQWIKDYEFKNEWRRDVLLVTRECEADGCEYQATCGRWCEQHEFLGEA